MHTFQLTHDLYGNFSYAPLGWVEASTGRLAPPSLHPADSHVAAGSATKNASEFMGAVTSQFLTGFCFFAISSARSMLSACTATLQRAFSSMYMAPG